jgi:amidohydrolase
MLKSFGKAENTWADKPAAMLKERIQELAREYHAEVVAIRRHLHQHPELSFEEYETGRYIARQLEAWGIEHRHGAGGTGVVAHIRGRNPEARLLALRADIDALPIQEANEHGYQSKHPGRMHACGHDVHTASLLGAARILHELREELEGSVRLIFQPGEEKLPGGASILIREGVLENPKPFAILGQHVHPPLHTGKVAVRPGKAMASADELYLTVTGKGGHAALPQNCIDPVLLSSHLVVGLQQIVSRRADPTIPSVLSFGKIQSEGGATNVIPNRVRLEGTFRTFDEAWRAEAHALMLHFVEHTARAMGGEAELRIDKGYPFLQNHEELTRLSVQLAQEFLGEEQVEEMPLRMTAEDFAYYSQVIPACFYRLGTGNPARGITAPVHTDRFDIDEAALETGSGLMAWLSVQLLRKESEGLA